MSEVKPPDQARGKIMRLPFAERMAFNRMVRDGFTARALISWLASHGLPGVNAENIRKYRQTIHYKEWLADEARVESEKLVAEQAMRLAEAIGGSASEKVKSILASKIFQVMPAMSDPDNIGKLISAVRSITEAERLELQRRQADQRDSALMLEREKFEEQKRRNAEARDKLETIKERGGISAETLKEIESAIGLL